ncbi:porin [Aquabacterium sp.]|uniref:porin n=1 Tax=Aquabacterium sp. TaxID=1872578 RepID=UPI002C7106B5|nr:porin [Aquabacterium sp.]HSW05201.1 porin [Aquabacterium sp.]
MKTLKLSSVAAALTCSAAFAQSPPPPPPPLQGPGPNAGPVQLYGAIDLSAVYVNNVKGGALRRIESGGNWPSRWGLRGREDLGDGLAAVFVIEQGFNADDGTIAQGGRAFGRQSFVGLSHAQYGTLTLGRQYDFAYAIPPDVVMIVGGLAAATGGIASDLHLGGVRYDNTVKYFGRYGPMQAGLMHGLGSENGQDKMNSALLGYREGSVNAALAYVRDNFSPVVPAAQGNQVLVASAQYYLNPKITLIGLVGESRAKLAADSRSRNRLVDFGLTWQVTTPFNLGFSVAQSDIKTATGADGRVRQFGVGGFYDFTRRTTLYAIGSSTRSEGAAGNAYSGVPGIGGTPATHSSSNRGQTVLKLGLRHFF